MLADLTAFTRRSVSWFVISLFCTITLVACGGDDRASTPENDPNNPIAGSGGDVAEEDARPGYYVVTNADALFVQENENGEMFLGPRPSRLSQRSWSNGIVISDPSLDASHLSTALTTDGRMVLTWLEMENGTVGTEGDTESATLFSAVYPMPESPPQQPLGIEKMNISRMGAEASVVVSGHVGLPARSSAVINPPAAQLVTTDAHSVLVWLQSGSLSTDGSPEVHLAYLAPGQTQWQPVAAFLSDTGEVFRVQLAALENGDVFIYWQERRPSNEVALMGRVFRTEAQTYGPVLPLAEGVMSGAMPAVWQMQGMPYLAIPLADSANTLATARVELTMGSVQWLESVGGTGQKSGPQGAYVSGRHVLVWLERDESGDRRVYGVQSQLIGDLQWGAPELLDEALGNASQLTLTTSGNSANVFWANIDQTVYGTLYAAGYDGVEFSAPELLSDKGADTPAAQFGADGRLYVMWRALHNQYREHHPGRGWQSARRIFCTKPTFGMCYEGGREQAIAVGDARGVAAWRERRQQRSVVALSLSWLDPADSP